MAQVWMTDLWLKDSVTKNGAGEIIKRIPPSKEELRSLAHGLKYEKVLPEHKTVAFGKRARWRVSWMENANMGSVRKSKDFKEKSLAEDYMIILKSKLLTGEYTPAEKQKIKFGEVAALWIEAKYGLKDSTLNALNNALKNYILPKWGQVPISKITELDCERWTAELLKDHSSSYVHVIVKNYFAGIMKFAAKRSNGFIAHSPVDDIHFKHNSKEKAFLTEDQVALLAEAAGNVGSIQDDILIHLLAYTGIRIGEAAALDVNDVNFETNRIRIYKTASKGANGEAIITSTKTSKSRLVPIPDFLFPELAQFCMGKELSAPLFTNSVGLHKGERLHQNTWYNTVFVKAKKESGLSYVENLTIHSLRHTYASLAARAGGEVRAVQEVMGHSTPITTLNVYTGLFSDSVDNLQKEMSKRAVAAKERKKPLL